MVDALSRMMKLPMATIACTMEVLTNTARLLQQIADRSIDTMTEGIVPAFRDTPTKGLHSGDRVEDGAEMKATYMETNAMDDQDLGGDDLKYVSYTILFTKRDLEAPLEKEQQDVVTYSTNGGSYGALKIAKFMYRVAHGRVRRPAVWRNNDYPPGAKDDTHWEIPEEDLKYITFIYSVDRRLPRQEAEYDKDQVTVLREIRNRL